MNLSAALLITSLIWVSSPREPWDAGLVRADKTEKMNRLKNDIANADVLVEVNGNDELDIGIGPSRTFTLDELQNYFKRQRHKDFIVVSYDKSSGKRDLGESFARLKIFLLDAGYRRILFTRANPSGVMVLGDFRVPQAVPKKLPTVEYEVSPDDGSEPVLLGPTATQQFHDTITRKVADFDPNLLEKAAPYGFFYVKDGDVYEHHYGLLVQRTKDEVKVWRNKWTEDLMKSEASQDDKWKARLKE